MAEIRAGCKTGKWQLWLADLEISLRAGSHKGQN